MFAYLTTIPSIFEGIQSRANMEFAEKNLGSLKQSLEFRRTIRDIYRELTEIP